MNDSLRISSERHGAAWLLCMGATTVLALAAAASLTGCGGGGGDAGSADTAAAADAPANATAGIESLANTPANLPTTGPTLAQREAAARQTAETNANCVAVQPFHWQIGDASGRLAGGGAGANPPTALTRMNVASASKLVYGAFVAELRHGQLSSEDVRFLNFTSGFTQFDRCLRDQTVAECQSYQSLLIHNGGYVHDNDGRFFYSGGHMQMHATLVGLGPDDNAALARDVNTRLGLPGAIDYVQPQLAGGVQTTEEAYGRFLQRIVAGQLKINALLGTHAVCTNPTTCATAASTPVPANESWHYSIGHWVEDDPQVGDGAFSSPGAFGFYPWIDKDKLWWGTLAREDHADSSVGQGVRSTYCGRQIRAAWLSGKPR
jgi:hypothetical protein